MLPATLNNDADIGFTFYGEDPASGAANDPSSDWIYWGDPDDKSPGEAGYTSFFAPGVGNVPTEGWTEVIARSMLMNWNGYASHTDSIALGSFSSTDPASWTAADTTLMTDAGWFLDPDNTLGVAEVDGDWVYGTVLHLPETGTIFRWITNKPNTGNDYYAFTSADAKSMTMENKEADIDKIMVVPNPYYGYHSGELDPFDRWVQFTYLPDVCTIRIFDLAGNLVRRLEKNDPSTTLMKWDLKNHNELPVASGIYVFHVEIPGVGEKVGKIAVFSPNERLDTY
jgi:hypothetical protein